MRSWNLALIAALLLTGCPRPDLEIQCSADSHCNLEPGGFCRLAPTGNRWCTYPDLTCPAGYRYSDFDVEDAVSGICVEIQGLVVVKSGIGEGKVVSTPPGIDCGVDCSEAFPLGTMVTLTPSANAGNTFMGWEGACTGTGACILTTTDAQTVTSLFACTGGGRTFSYTGHVETFTPPACATQMTIDASGAQGGNNGGLGARIVGTFSPTGPLNVLVGGQGAQDSASNGGGGGGSFVFIAATDANPLIAAGGGGGSTGTQGGGPGSATTVPKDTTGGSGNAQGGFNGGGGGGGEEGSEFAPGTGGGGSGWIGDGGPGFSASFGFGGRSPRNDGRGGRSSGSTGAVGGFGGGGGSAGSPGSCGGGGGYNGGGGGHGLNAFGRTGWGSGGGGGSFNSGTNQTAVAGVRAGDGIVIISWQ